MGSSRWLVPVSAALLFAMIAWAYWPGLSGPFLFDDFGNLDVLGAQGRIRSLPTLLYYLTSGQADPTGRPVALLSFLLDAQDWPAPPWPFKRTNLLIHLANGILLGVVIARLQSRLQQDDGVRTSRWTPAVAAALWCAHPFFVSTTLYVVQREAMLPMGFVLIAILCWDRAVRHFDNLHVAKGWLWAVLGTGGATLLAGLSKANGLLAPLLVGITYIFFMRSKAPSDPGARRSADFAALLCLLVPALLVVAYVVYTGIQLWNLPTIPGRNWSLPQRLLSEPRAIWEYVWRLALPRAGGGGVFVDDFQASRGWLDPPVTLPALLALLASVVAAYVGRHRYRVLSFAWLFFIAGHLLESTTIPLELYFEHRNYMPAMFLGWPIANGLLRPGRYGRYRAALVLMLLAACLLLTRQRALVWGNEALLDSLSASHEAASPRSQVAAAGNEFELGDARAALAHIEAAQQANPLSVDVAISAIGVECHATGALMPDHLQRARWTLEHAITWNYGLFTWLQDAVQNPVMRNCRGFGLAGIRELTSAAEANPRTQKIPGRLRDIWHVRGRIAIAEGDPATALRWFDAAIDRNPNADYALVQAAALGEARAPALGVRHLDRFLRLYGHMPLPPVRDMYTLHNWLLQHYGYYTNQIIELRDALQDDARRGATRRSP